MLRIEGMSKSFGTLEVLKDVSLHVHKGEVVVIIGRSGSGKSTLLRCVNGLEPIDSGSIWFESRQVIRTPRDLRDLRKQVGFVFQNFNLFPHLTALQNVALGPRVVKRVPKREAESRAMEELSRVGLADKCDSYPANLSGGQQQRVAIARGLAMDPKLMLFDEVTSALDPELIGEVLKVMEDLANSGMTMLSVTHEMGFARHVADRVVFMHGGRIEEEGPPDQVFDHPESPNLRQFIGAIL